MKRKSYFYIFLQLRVKFWELFFTFTFFGIEMLSLCNHIFQGPAVAWGVERRKTANFLNPRKQACTCKQQNQWHIFSYKYKTSIL